MKENLAKPWYAYATGYVIYPATFYDANDDGVGDIQGIIEKLDYLSWLGVDLLWICPLFASPMDDNGYDVSDYYQINPRFGTNDDFVRLVEEAHKKGIRLLIDFVMNHTSSEHSWFQKALKDPNSKERSYYYFKKGRKEGDKLLPPNNWKGYFSTSAWENVPGTDDFYLHLFSAKMPDVNWNNPELREEYYKIARFYLDLGVDGFRLDALSHLGKDLSFADSRLSVDENGLVLDPSKFANREELYGFLAEFKEKVLIHYDALMLGEVGGGISPEESLRLTDKEKGAIDMVFNFDTAWCNGAYGSIDKKDEEIVANVIELKNNFKRWFDKTNDRAKALPVYWDNHDHPRALSQYGSVKYRKESGKMLLATLLFTYGTSFLLYGDEIGMSNVQFNCLEDFDFDVSAHNEIARLLKLGYPKEQILSFMRRTSRVNGRQLMQWDENENAGFSNVKPIIPANPNYLEGVNVKDQADDPDSILNFARLAIKVRKEYIRFMAEGRFELYDHLHPDVNAFSLSLDEERLVVISSFRPYNTYFGFYWTVSEVLLHNYEDVEYHDHVFTLRPFECLVLLTY